MKSEFRERYIIVILVLIHGGITRPWFLWASGIRSDLSTVTENIICNQPALTKGLCSYRMEDAGLEPPDRYEVIGQGSDGQAAQ
jgi:hypothetical protein